MTPGFGYTYLQSLTDQQGNVHVIWKDYGFSPFQELFYTKLDNNGNTLIDDMRVTNEAGQPSYAAYITADPQRYPHLVRANTLQSNTKFVYKRAGPSVGLVRRGEVCFGCRVELGLYSYPNAQYALALSFGTMPGIPLGDGRVIPLNPDAIFFLSLSGALGLQNNIGTLDSQGRGTAIWNVPNVPEARGLTLYAAFVTINPAQPMPRTVTSISPAVPLPLPL